MEKKPKRNKSSIGRNDLGSNETPSINFNVNREAQTGVLMCCVHSSGARLADLMWGVVAATLAVLLALCSMGAAARKADLEILVGMDDEVVFAHLRRLYLASWRGFWDALLPAAPQTSLGVYEPASLSFRLLIARASGGVSIHAMAMASLLLHAVSTALSCVFAQLLLGLLTVSRATRCDSSEACTRKLYKPSKVPSKEERETQEQQVTIAYARQHAACAFLASAFFGTHPMRVEVVCWMSCQPYLLASSLCLVCMILRLLGGSRNIEIVVFIFAAFSKAAVLTLPVVLIILDLLNPSSSFVFARRFPGASKAVEAHSDRPAYLNRPVQYAGKIYRSLWWNMPFFCISTMAAIASAITSGPVPTDIRRLEWRESLLRACFGASFYMWRTVTPPWPWTTPRFALPAVIDAIDPAFGLSFLFITLSLSSLLTFCMMPAHPMHHNAKLLLFAFAAYCSMLLPCSGLASAGHVWALAADRYSYAPSMCILTPSLAVLLDCLCHWIRRRCKRNAHIILVVIPLFSIVSGATLVAISLRSQQVASYWIHGTSGLFESILQVAPNEFSTIKDLGSVHAKQGKLQSASSLLRRASMLRPAHAGVSLNLATVFHQARRIHEAEAWYRTARRIARIAVDSCLDCVAQATELAKADANAAALLLQTRRAQEAVAVLEAGLPWRGALATARAPGLYHLGLACASLGQREKAARFYREAVSAAPGVANGAASEALARLERQIDVAGIR